MIDLASIQIPVDDKFVTPFYDNEGRICGGEFDLRIAHKFGCRLSAGHVDIDGDKTELSRLTHPFESIPSSNSSVSFKIRPGAKNYWPFFEVKASPAKLLQGHNAFGSDDPHKCLVAPLVAFGWHFPDISELINYRHASISQIDCTYTAHTENQFLAKQIIQMLRHVSSGQIRASNQSFETSVLWNAGSTHCVREVYLKYFEVMRQIETIEKKIVKSPEPYLLTQLEHLKSNIVQDYIKNAVRFEAKIKSRMLKRLSIPTRIKEFCAYSDAFEGNLIENLWSSSWDDIFKTFEGEHVNIYDDDEILKKLENAYFKYTSTGKITYSKAHRLFRFFRSIKNEGYQSVLDTTPRMTFYRNISELTEVVPKAYLQNLSSKVSNVVPFVKIINVDFSRQLPAGYVEPACLAEQLTGQPIKLFG